MPPLQGQDGAGSGIAAPTTYGVWGDSNSGDGVLGTSDSGEAVRGISNSNLGIRGSSTGASGVAGHSRDSWGVSGSTTNGGAGVFGQGGTDGVFGASSDGGGSGIHGKNDSGGSGVAGESPDGTGVYGLSLKHDGVYGASESGRGVHGSSESYDGVGGESESGYGVYGTSDSKDGVFGTSQSGSGVVGTSNAGHGVFGFTAAQRERAGVTGRSGSGSGNSFFQPVAVWGDSGSGSGNDIAVLATAKGNGVVAFGENAGVIGYGQHDMGIFGSSKNFYAGYFDGDVFVKGSVTKGGGGFRIDHPLDPANKYLVHSFVESSEMKNMYDGVAVLNAKGEANVKLPAWFEALNGEFRYQLTAIGAPAPNLHIAAKIRKNSFKIAGGKKGTQVSWQVTGNRKDRWAQRNRITPEEKKSAREKGHYLHPRLFGKAEDKGVEWARHPELMKTLRQAGKRTNRPQR